MTVDDATASQYRREAAELRHASEIVRDPGLCAQLLDIAGQYEAAAAEIEQAIMLARIGRAA